MLSSRQLSPNRIPSCLVNFVLAVSHMTQLLRIPSKRGHHQTNRCHHQGMALIKPTTPFADADCQAVQCSPLTYWMRQFQWHPLLVPVRQSLTMKGKNHCLSKQQPRELSKGLPCTLLPWEPVFRGRLETKAVCWPNCRPVWDLFHLSTNAPNEQILCLGASRPAPQSAKLDLHPNIRKNEWGVDGLPNDRSLMGQSYSPSTNDTNANIPNTNTNK